jgi:intracellular septation protein A
VKNFLYAVRPLAVDFLGMIVFAILLAIHAPILVAVAAGGAIAAGVIVLQAVRKQPVAPLQWLSLISVLAAGALALLTNDPRWLMAKPSVIYVAVAVAMLQRGWMLRYVPPEGRPVVGDLMIRFGYIWSGLMFLTAILNLIVAVAFPDDWPLFVAIFPLASKALLFAIHFGYVSAVAKSRAQSRASELAAG